MKARFYIIIAILISIFIGVTYFLYFPKDSKEAEQAEDYTEAPEDYYISSIFDNQQALDDTTGYQELSVLIQTCLERYVYLEKILKESEFHFQYVENSLEITDGEYHLKLIVTDDKHIVIDTIVLPKDSTCKFACEPSSSNNFNMSLTFKILLIIAGILLADIGIIYICICYKYISLKKYLLVAIPVIIVVLGVAFLISNKIAEKKALEPKEYIPITDHSNDLPPDVLAIINEEHLREISPFPNFVENLKTSLRYWYEYHLGEGNHAVTIDINSYIKNEDAITFNIVEEGYTTPINCTYTNQFFYFDCPEIEGYHDEDYCYETSFEFKEKSKENKFKVVFSLAHPPLFGNPVNVRAVINGKGIKINLSVFNDYEEMVYLPAGDMHILGANIVGDFQDMYPIVFESEYQIARDQKIDLKFLDYEKINQMTSNMNYEEK